VRPCVADGGVRIASLRRLHVAVPPPERQHASRHHDRDEEKKQFSPFRHDTPPIYRGRSRDASAQRDAVSDGRCEATVKDGRAGVKNPLRSVGCVGFRRGLRLREHHAQQIRDLLGKRKGRQRDRNHRDPTRQRWHPAEQHERQEDTLEARGRPTTARGARLVARGVWAAASRRRRKPPAALRPHTRTGSTSRQALRRTNRGPGAAERCPPSSRPPRQGCARWW
jgi:hypothetical protein